MRCITRCEIRLSLGLLLKISETKSFKAIGKLGARRLSGIIFVLRQPSKPPADFTAGSNLNAIFQKKQTRHADQLPAMAGLKSGKYIAISCLFIGPTYKNFRSFLRRLGRRKKPYNLGISADVIEENEIPSLEQAWDQTDGL
jgi:hypothetical protein